MPPNHAEDMFSTEELLMEQCWECQAFVLLMGGMEEEEHQEFFLALKRLRRKWGKWIDGATKIIEGKACKDGSGKVVGYRVIAYFAKTDKTDEYNAVAWTNDRQFYWLWSKNLETALTEEKRINTANASEQEIARPK
jgi:hypothetical protein